MKRLLEWVSSIDIGPVEPLLAKPLSFCGGDDWLRIQMEEVLPRIRLPLRAAARLAVESLAALEPAEEVFSHGDLGGHNVFWKDGRVSGVLDWDLASASDRSTDLASLGVWHGWEKLPAIAPPEEVCRAAVRRDTFRLQQVGFLIVSNRPDDEVTRAIHRAEAWIEEHLIR
ncbi:hypothetical protein GCM10027403_20020 [Arthrobacter tecti]